MSTQAQYIFHFYLEVNPKGEFDIKMVVTVGLQDISSMYITLETSYVFIFMFIIQDLSWLDFASVDSRNERDNGRHAYYKGLRWQNPVSLILK